MATQSTCTYSLPFTATVAIDAHSSKAVGRDVKSPPPKKNLVLASSMLQGLRKTREGKQ